MTEAFKRLNAKVEALLQENAKLMEQVQSLKGKGTIQKVHTSTQTSESSFPSQNKMDEQGVHSPTNAKRSTVSDKRDTASLVQMVAAKDTSNPFMAVILPKNEDEGCSSSRRRLPRSFTQIETTTKKTMLHKKKKNDKIESIITKTLEKFFQSQGQDKHINPDPNPDPSRDKLVPDLEQDRINTSSRGDCSSNNNVTRSLSSGEKDYARENYQDAQDPDDDDSGMSFDSIDLHNLDT
ncbi:hypothetical protein H5410_048824 [Solanum commersonii]|uniref:Uncharacterized protein n=1 Tax=Solanum commersonii TaxID=4109 RepID=A0A9J5XMW2_SOLCO|nr:hypothetical protein H5410_048824 [Solanum commersonii]